MNWGQHIRFAAPGNGFLRTVYSPNTRGEQLVSKSNHPIAPVVFALQPGNYSQWKNAGRGGGE
jgi:hypothetical protein